MDLKRYVTFASGVAVFGAVLLAAFPHSLPPAVAEEEPTRTLLKTADQLLPEPFDPDKLLRWDFTIEPGVEVEVRAQSTIKKISYGRTSYVSIVETDSGVYSSDGLDSPNVEYPGITKEPRRAPGMWVLGARGWVVADLEDADSFRAIVPFGEDCAELGETVYC